MNIYVVGTENFQDNWDGNPTFPRSKVASDVESYWNEQFEEESDDWTDDLYQINVEEYEGYWVPEDDLATPAGALSDGGVCDHVLACARRDDIHDVLYSRRFEYRNKNADDRWEAIIVLDYMPDTGGDNELYGLATLGSAGDFEEFSNRIAWVNMYPFMENYTSWLDETSYVGVAMHELLHIFNNEHEDAKFERDGGELASYISNPGRDLNDDWCNDPNLDPNYMSHFMSDCVFDNTGNHVDEHIKPYIDDDDDDPPGSGCFITTATHEHPETLDSLRRFRDQSMAKTTIGKALISLYYQISPPIAKTLETNPNSITANLTRSIVRRCAKLSNRQNDTGSMTLSALLAIYLTLWYIVGLILASTGHLYIQTKNKIQK